MGDMPNYISGNRQTNDKDDDDNSDCNVSVHIDSVKLCFLWYLYFCCIVGFIYGLNSEGLDLRTG